MLSISIAHFSLGLFSWPPQCFFSWPFLMATSVQFQFTICIPFVCILFLADLAINLKLNYSFVLHIFTGIGFSSIPHQVQVDFKRKITSIRHRLFRPVGKPKFRFGIDYFARSKNRRFFPKISDRKFRFPKFYTNYNRAIEKIEIKRNKFIIYGYLLINGRNKCLEY